MVSELILMNDVTANGIPSTTTSVSAVNGGKFISNSQMGASFLPGLVVLLIACSPPSLKETPSKFEGSLYCITAIPEQLGRTLGCPFINAKEKKQAITQARFSQEWHDLSPMNGVQFINCDRHYT